MDRRSLIVVGLVAQVQATPFIRDVGATDLACLSPMRSLRETHSPRLAILHLPTVGTAICK